MVETERVKVVFLINSLNSGGAERVVMELARGLDSTRYFSCITCLHYKGMYFDSFAQEMHQTGQGEAVCLGLPFHINWRELKSLAVWLRQYQPDIVQTFLQNPNRWGVLAAKLAKASIIVSSLRNAPPSYTLRQRLLDKISIHLVTRCVACSEAVKEHHVRKFGFPARKIVTIHNGVDVRRFDMTRKERGQVRLDLGLGKDEIAVAVVASLTPQKGHRCLIDAVNNLRQDCTNLRVVLIGDGGLRNAIEREIAEHSLEPHIQLLGRRDDVPRLLQGMDLFVLPSLWEGMPNVVLEAMAAGLPVVATAVGGTPQVVVNGETGYLVPAEDADQLANAIRKLVIDAEERQRMGHAGRKRVEEHFSREIMVRKFHRLYTNLLVMSDVMAGAA